MVEICLALLVVWKYRAWPVSRLIVATLTCLAVFQLAEYMVCQGAMGMNSIEWAKTGFVAISLLPPLGLHIASEMSGRTFGKQVMAGYGLAAAFSAYFLFSTQGISGSVCGGNYVIFDLAPHAVNAFTVYYYVSLTLGLVLSLHWARRSKDQHIASALKGLSAGYASFMIPTTAVNIVNPATVSGIPSIMCGFAVALAFVLVFWVMPQYVQSQMAHRVPSVRHRHKTAV